MSEVPDPEAVARFREILARRLGLQFDDAKDAFLADILRRHAAAVGLNHLWFLERLHNPGSAPEWRTLIQALTVTETYFFRNAAQFAALRDAALSSAAPLRVLSAGCASGEEPYSVAMTLADRPATISAVDINGAMLAKATIGRYSTWSLRETGADLRARWFAAHGSEYVLDGAIRGAVTFEERNLADDDNGFWRPHAFDIVFCRNVLMYFAPAAARAAIARIARSLVPGGLLFLGHAETLRGLSRDFELRHTHGTFYYRRQDVLSAADDAPADPVGTSPPPVHEDGIDGGAGWYDAIESAAARVRTIAARPMPATVGATAAASAIAGAMALMADEHYAEALSLLGALPEDAARDTDAMFLHGVLLMHRGDFVGAERARTALFMRHGETAGAHYLMALCREARGDADAAARHDRHAAALDPHFALPRLHLGLLARRTGDRRTARQELARAFALLPGEQPSRLLMFGGGFGRDALRVLCQAELVSAGGAP